MNNMNKSYILIGGVSALVGFIGGWVAKCFHVRKHPYVVEKYPVPAEPPSKEPEAPPEPADIPENEPETEENANNYADYKEIMHNYKIEQNETPQAMYDFDRPLVRRSKPYEIDEEAYRGDNGYAKYNLLLYSDGVIEDLDRNEVVEDWRAKFGVKLIQDFEVSDRDHIYIRNDELEEDYLIEACPLGYGVSDDDEDEEEVDE